MTGSSKNNGENYPRKCFWTQEKEVRVKFNPGLSANRPSNNWAQRFKGLENVSLVSICFPCSIWGSPIGFSGCGISLIWRSGFGIIKPNRARFGIESTREDQFTGLSFITLYSRFYWSRSTKDPADPHWFVFVVLPSQVFQISSRICTRTGQNGFKASSWSISGKKITSRESEMYSKTHRLPVPCAFYRLRALILISLQLVTAGFVESTISVG